MARQQTIVQLSDELLALLDARAARRGISRSELIREAIEDHVKGDRDAATDAAIIEGYTRIPPPKHDPWAEAGARLLRRGTAGRTPVGQKARAGRLGSSTFRACSAPLTGSPAGSSKPICTSTLAWSQ